MLIFQSQIMASASRPKSENLFIILSLQQKKAALVWGCQLSIRLLKPCLDPSNSPLDRGIRALPFICRKTKHDGKTEECTEIWVHLNTPF